MTIHVLRHTTPDIPKGICYGQSDVGVLPTFQIEAKAVVQQLKPIDYDVIYTSPLSRCKHLAHYVWQQTVHSLPLIEDKRLMEMNFGRWEQLHYDEIAKDEASKGWYADYINTSCPEGESYLDLYDRMQSFIKDLQVQQDYKQPSIVTHAGNIRTLYAMVKNYTYINTFDVNIKYGSITNFII